MKVLVIEDSKDVSKALCRLLEASGYETLSAANEEEAERVLNASGKKISIAIVDMKFPAKEKGFQMEESGLRIIKLLASQYPEIVSIVYTGHDEYRNAMNCMAAGSSYYLEKEPETKLLEDIVKRAANRWSERRKLKKTTDASVRVAQSLSELEQCLREIDKPLRQVQGLAERIRDEIQYIEGSGDVRPA